MTVSTEMAQIGFTEVNAYMLRLVHEQTEVTSREGRPVLIQQCLLTVFVTEQSDCRWAGTWIVSFRGKYYVGQVLSDYCVDAAKDAVFEAKSYVATYYGIRDSEWKTV